MIAGVAGAVLFLPAISFVGTLLCAVAARSRPRRTVPPLLADAIWARANGGRATQLQPLNPFTIARTATCHVFAEFDEPERRETRSTTNA